MDPQVSLEFQKNIEKLRAVVVKIKGPVEGISKVKKSSATPKTKKDNVVTISNVIEKD